ncbi:endonuclease/exonuclease/phosphatase family protein [Roseibium sediminis]|uniref:endonuclease/exonuclease/phosphatase family protein n=1 Tax=Roseibium sediminis TaxID=1775174 RepID=UPI00123D60EB|nr:endonuclease/exonuclease/phosphatase family protein [Roseibium sediminis]
MADYFLAFWNLENLFGPENHAHRLPWVASQIAKDLNGWTPALYQTKLRQLASIIRQMNGGNGPDILGICEVEDQHVLKDLIAVLAPDLPNRDYDVIAETNDLSYRGIDTAFLYDKTLFSVDPALVFNHRVMRRTGTRDILQATFRTQQSGKELVAMANHWPSRHGGAGAEASAGFRATAGETLSYWHSRIFEEAAKKDRTPVIAFGDMNDDPWDRSLTINALATRELGDVERAKSPKFYNIAWEYLTAQAKDHKGNDRLLEGTLYFNDNGNVFDHLLVNRPLVDRKTDSEFKYVGGSGGIIAFPEMVSHRTGEGPIRFGLPKGNAAKNVNETGFSDHFPVGLKIREV